MACSEAASSSDPSSTGVRLPSGKEGADEELSALRSPAATSFKAVDIREMSEMLTTIMQYRDTSLSPNASGRSVSRLGKFHGCKLWILCCPVEQPVVRDSVQWFELAQSSSDPDAREVVKGKAVWDEEM